MEYFFVEVLAPVSHSFIGQIELLDYLQDLKTFYSVT